MTAARYGTHEEAFKEVMDAIDSSEALRIWDIVKRVERSGLVVDASVFSLQFEVDDWVRAMCREGYLVREEKKLQSAPPPEEAMTCDGPLIEVRFRRNLQYQERNDG